MCTVGMPVAAKKIDAFSPCNTRLRDRPRFRVEVLQGDLCAPSRIEKGLSYQQSLFVELFFLKIIKGSSLARRPSRMAFGSLPCEASKPFLSRDIQGIIAGVSLYTAIALFIFIASPPAENEDILFSGSGVAPIDRMDALRTFALQRRITTPGKELHCPAQTSIAGWTICNEGFAAEQLDAGGCRAFSFGATSGGNYAFEREISRPTGTRGCDVHLFLPPPTTIWGLIDDTKTMHVLYERVRAPGGTEGVPMHVIVSEIVNTNSTCLGADSDGGHASGCMVNFLKMDCAGCAALVLVHDLKFLRDESRIYVHEVLLRVDFTRSTTDDWRGMLEGLRILGYRAFHKETRVSTPHSHVVDLSFVLYDDVDTVMASGAHDETTHQQVPPATPDPEWADSGWE